MSSQRSQRRVLRARRQLGRVRQECIGDLMRVFVSAEEHALANTKMRQLTTRIRNECENDGLRVVISNNERKLTDEKSRQILMDDRRQPVIPIPQDVRELVNAQIHPVPPAPQPRRRHAEIPHRVTYRLALTTQNVENITPFSLGSQQEPFSMTQSCRFCLAEFFEKEPCRRNGDRFLCCKFGKVSLPLVKECPRELKLLLSGNSRQAIAFRENIRSANSMFAMASFKAKIPENRNIGQGNWCFHICGQIYHHALPIPDSDERGNFIPDNVRYNQYYFIDAQEAIQRRSAFFGQSIDAETVRTIELFLRRDNPFIRSYMTMAEVIRNRRQERRDIGKPAQILIGFKDRMSERIREFDLPIGDNTEVAAVFEGEDPPFNVDLTIYERATNRSIELKNLNRLADPMVYPILFPLGDYGYQTGVRLISRPSTLADRNGRIYEVNEILNNRPVFENPNSDDEMADDQGNPAPPRDGRRTQRQFVTMREFYRYRIVTRKQNLNFEQEGGIDDGIFRPAEFSTLHNGGKLFQQYLVDAWVRTEADQLWYIRQHQRTLRRANLGALRRFLEMRAQNLQARIGKIVYLPASFTGGMRNLNRKYLDAMTLVARHGKPDLFITLTCNPRWREITENLKFRQKYEHRPDLVCRVFHRKLLELIDDIYHKQYFGVPLNYMYSIEFQKRGLPHAHILLTLRGEDKLSDEQSVDAAVQAAFPNPVTEPVLFDLIARHMIHRPCGILNPEAPCMRDGRCSKYFPKPFRDETNLVGEASAVGQPDYKRPQDGRGVDMGGVFMDNSRVVPFNRLLTAKYDCHINVECCGSLKSIKYLHKYINKGPDYISVQHQEDTEGDRPENEQRVIDWDEPQQYTDYRYVSSPESVWRLFEFKLSDRSHAVLVLPVHLPGQQDVLFEEEMQPDEIDQLADRRTKLEAWFLLNLHDFQARQLYYQQIPEFYTWENRECEWRPRRQISKMLGCIAEVSPEEPDRFYLRMLLSHVRGATSFDALRTVNGVIYETYKDACRAMNLFLNNDEYERCLRDAINMGSPFRIRNLFALVALLMATDGIESERIANLWHLFKDDMIADFVAKGDSINDSEMKCLYHLKVAIRRSVLGGDRFTMNDLGLRDVNLDDPMFINVLVDIGRLSRDDTIQNPIIENRIRHTVSSLNADQLLVYNAVMEAVVKYIQYGHVSRNNLFFVDGPGGTGKTFLYNVLLDQIENTLERKCLPVAWTGIAATLLRDGKTVHSTFRLPLDLTDETVAGYPLDSDKAKTIREAVIILWDEAPMTPHRAVEAIKKYLQDLMGRPGIAMGGKVVLFGGDFRQLLPVIPGAHSGQIVRSSLKGWHLWPQVQNYRLEQNLRVQRANDGGLADNFDFADYLLRLGNGLLPTINMPLVFSPKDLIEIHRNCLLESCESLIDYVYGKRPVITDLDIADKAILSPTNRAVDEINNLVLDRLEGTSRTYFSVDRYLGEDEGDDLHVPQDFLHSINVAGLPPHELKLKVGAVVMLVRNIDLSSGLCNGTRLRVLTLDDHVLKLQVLTGSIDSHRGNVIYLPKMTVKAHNNTNLPRPMTRFQFPVKIAFAMTINKSQGQTFKKVGVYLDTPCFTHGQLYVAMSRTGSLDSIKFFIKNSSQQGRFAYRHGRQFTRNVVFPSIVENARLLYTSQSRHDRENQTIVRPYEIPSQLLAMLDAARTVDWSIPFADNVSELLKETNSKTQRCTQDILDDDVDYENQTLPFLHHNQPVTNLPADEELPGRVSVYTQPGTSSLHKSGVPYAKQKSILPVHVCQNNGDKEGAQKSNQEELDDDVDYENQELPFLHHNKPVTNLPRNQDLPSRLAINTQPGTSALHPSAVDDGKMPHIHQINNDSDDD